MTEEKTVRLSKALKECNISVQHAVDFLAGKGFKIESNPNTKLSPEAYDVLMKEFQSDKSAREEAQQITMSKLRKETTASIVADETKITPRKKETEQDEILIKGSSAYAAKEKPKEKEKEIEIKPAAEKPVEKKTEKPDVIKAKGDKIEGPKVLGKVVLEEEKKSPKKKKETEKEKKEREKKEKAAKAKPKTKKEKEKEAEEEKQSKKKSTSKSKSKTEEPEEIVEEQIETPVAEEKAQQPEAPAEEPKEIDQVIRAKADKLEGPTILGRIDLPVDPPKRKPVASSSSIEQDRLRKKKRRRTEKKGETPSSGTPAPRQDFQRPQHGRPPGTGSGPGVSRYKGRGPRPQLVKPELTDKQIQDQIKTTLARLSSGGKSKAAKMRKQRREQASQDAQEQMVTDEAQKKIIKVTEFVSANELAKMMNVQVTDIISACMSLGIFASINQRLDAETLSVVAEEFGFTVEFVSADVQESIKMEDDKPEDLLPRPPIVTVMGHVDHGKTSLLDYIRKANVIAGEAGGITQHIGAYEVELENKKKIAFLDTPGHEAFTAMRARGAKVTDVAIIVIAADDSVMPQTVEAINHAQAAGVPIVFAFNKMDRPEANAERLREQLSKMNILVEEWGGKYQTQEISAKKGDNVDALLEKVLLEADMLDLKANPAKNAVGTVIEASLDKGRGYITTLLIQSGTLHVGDVLLAGCHSGRVKAMFNERGAKITDAGPSTPVLVLGLSGAPQAGDRINVMDDEREARDIANKRLQLQREQGIRTHKHITLDEIGRRLAIGNFKELNIIVKGDVDGSIEALADSLLKLSNPEIQVNIIHKSVGQISESDVLLASASNAIIIGFQVRPSVNARKLAEQEQIDIRLYSIIYDAINEIKAAMEGMLAPEFEEKIVCNIEIRETFKIPKVGTVAGCMVLDGKVMRNTKVRIVRDGIVVFTGELASLRRFKDDVKEVAAGYECGLNIANFNDIKVGDIIEGYEQVAVKRTLA